MKEAFTAHRRFSGVTMLSSFAALAGIVVLLVLSLANEYREIDKHAQAEVKNISRVLEEHALATVQKADLLLREVQRNVQPEDMRLDRGVSSLRRQALHALLKSQLESVPEVAVIHVTDAKGNHIYSSLDPVPRINIADRYHFRRQKDDATAGLVISPPIVSRTTGKWTIVLTRRLSFADGSFAGIINVILKLEYFQQFYRTLNLGKLGMVALYDKELRLAARYPPSEQDMGRIVSNIAIAPYIGQGVKHGVVHGKSVLDDVVRLRAFHQVNDLPLIVIAGIADDDYLAEWRRHVWQYSLGAIVFSLVVIAFGLRQRRAEQALRESEERTRQLMKVVPIPLCYVLKGGVIEDFNDRFAQVFGYTHEDIPTLEAWWRLAYPDVAYRRWVLETWDAAVRLAAASGQDICPVEYRVTCKNGDVRIMEISGVTLGENFLATFIDLTERKRIEVQLRNERDFVEGLVNTAPAIVLVLDTQGRIVRLNPYMEAISGYAFAEVQGQNWFDIFLPKSRREQTKALFLNAIDDIQTCGNEDIIVTRDGRERIIEWNDKTLKDAEGRTLGLLAIGQDITERKLAERELKRSNAELEQFSYAISHDMRQPLRMISSYLQLLEKRLAGQLDGEKREFFDFAIDGAQRLDRMLVALLEYSRVGRKGEPPVWIESRELLDEALLFLQPAIVEAQAELTIGGDWPRIFVSRDEVMRLIQNLIGNAVKYRVAGRKPEIAVTGGMVCDEWCLSVADNGVGIPPGQIGRLFQVFQRLQTRAAFEGDGIGLALCRKITEHHGGRVWAESPGENQGSTFCVSLPVPQEESARLPPSD
ncbi:MAG: PAS domain S-box protein [Sulfuricellaceae bacterium]